MVCKKCGRSFNDNSKSCPFCGVGQESHFNIKKLENEFEKLKIEDNTSSFYDDKIDDFEIFDIEDIIDELEELKIKNEKNDETPVPRVEPISDEEIIDLISDIKENKELFITDKSQYQYIPKKQDDTKFINKNNDHENIGLNDLLKKQKLYNPEEARIEKKYDIKLPEVLTINKKEKNYKKEITLGLISVLIVAFIIIFFVYQYMFSPKTKLLKDISSKYSEIQKIIEKSTSNFSELLKYDDVSINSTYTINTNDNQQSYSEITNLKYIENKLDKSQYYEYTNFNKYKSEYDKMFIHNNKLYVNKENLTNEFYSTDARFISILNNDDDFDYIFNKFIDALKSNIKNKNFEVKTIKENNLKYKEVTLKIDEKLYGKIYSCFLKEITEDEKTLQIIKDKFQYSNVGLMKVINSKLEELKTKTSNRNILTYKFYLKDNKIVKYLISYNNTDITLSIMKDGMELTINQNKEEILYLKLKSTDERLNRYNIILNYDNYQLSGDYYEEDNRIIFNYQKKYGTDTDKEIVNLVLTKGEKEDKKYTNNIFIAYQKTENNNVINKTVNGTNIIEADTEIPILDVSNNVKVMEDALRNELKEKFSMFIK